jgi:hypothetical protein
MALWDKLRNGIENQRGATSRKEKTIVISPLPEEVKVEALRAEQEAYLRRVAVCTELRRVALERGDEVLYHQADELEREAEAVYRLRVGRLGLRLSPTPEGVDTRSASTRHSATHLTQLRRAAERLAPPPPPVPVMAEARIREVKP